MKKHLHILTVNYLDKNLTEYTYEFGHTKNIKLSLSKTGFSISVELNKIYDKEEMLSGNSYLFPDSIRKGLLLYLIKYNKSLDINSITVKIDDEYDKVTFDEKVKPLIYSMVNGNLQREISKTFSNDIVFDYLLNTPKSKYDKRIASLFALLCGKSKEYETERFIYLWTSFNGMYSWLSVFIALANNTDKYRKECKKIEGLQQFIGVGNETIAGEDISHIADSVISILKKVPAECVGRSDIEAEEISKKIEGVLKEDFLSKKYNLTAYGYVLTQLAYYFRCKIIHGSKPVYLFSYADDKELHSLKIINALLEEFIDDNLPLWFDEKYISDNIIPKSKTIKLSKQKCNK